MKSYWIKSGLITLLDKLSALIFGFGGFYFLVRATDKETFGTWALFLTVTTLIETARNGLIQNAVIKFLSSTEENKHKDVISASLALNIILTSISAVVLFWLSAFLSSIWHSPQLELMFRFYILTTVALIPFAQFNFIQQANLDFRGVFASNFIRQGFLFCYILILYISGTSIELIQLVNFQTIAAVLGSLTSYIFSRKYISFTLKIDWQWISKLFHYGKFVFGTNISSVLFKSSDQMLLGYLVTPVAVAIFNLATRIINLFEVPITSVASIVFPQSSKRIHTEGIGAAKDLYEKSVAVMLLMIMPGILILISFTEFFVVLIAGESYKDAVPVLRVILLQVIFIPFGRQFGTILDSIGKPDVNFYFILISAFANLSLNYIFIITYGVIGAAYGTLIMYTISFVFTQWYLKKHLNISLRNVFFYSWEIAMSFTLKSIDGIKRMGVKK